MRFYLFDGKAALGPYEAEELPHLPGFGAESVVCPVGSQKVDDWKPAGAHEQLRPLLFKPRPSMAPAAQSEACPVCANRNPSEAVFCNRCGGRISELGPAPTSSFAPSPAPHFSPLATEPAPLVFPSPEPPAPTPWTTYAASLGAILATFLVFFVWLKPKKNSAPPQEAPVLAASVTPPAPPPLAAAPPPQPPPIQTPIAQPQPRVEAPPPVAVAKPRRKRRRPRPAPRVAAAPEPAPAPKDDVSQLDELLATSIPEAPKAKPQEAAVEKSPKALNLPGFPPAQPVRAPVEDEAASSKALPPISDREKMRLQNAREQFDFCHHLMLQQAFGDVFDTCLCRDSRKAAPFNGHKETYVRLSEEAAASDAAKERSSFEITEAKLRDPAAALITARWNIGKTGKGKESSETWLLEEGVWCLQQ